MAKNVFMSKDERTQPVRRNSLEFKFLSWLKIPNINRQLAVRAGLVFVLMMLSVMSHHHYISILKQIEEAKRERSGSRAMYINLKASHEVQQRQSEVSKQLETLESDVKITNEPPVKMVVSNKK
jgi:Bacteriodetes cell division protein (FtsL-like)